MMSESHPFKPYSAGLAYSTMRHLTNHREVEGKELASRTGPGFGEAHDRWRYEDPEDFVPDKSVLELESIEEQAATQRYLDRLEREIFGAWMADYDYLYQVDSKTLEPTLYIPSNTTEPPYDPKLHQVERYDLRWIFPQDIKELRS